MFSNIGKTKLFDVCRKKVFLSPSEYSISNHDTFRLKIYKTSKAFLYLLY